MSTNLLGYTLFANGFHLQFPTDLFTLTTCVFCRCFIKLIYFPPTPLSFLRAHIHIFSYNWLILVELLFFGSSLLFIFCLYIPIIIGDSRQRSVFRWRGYTWKFLRFYQVPRKKQNTSLGRGGFLYLDAAGLLFFLHSIQVPLCIAWISAIPKGRTEAFKFI
jgi:hypothetical protein